MEDPAPYLILALGVLVCLSALFSGLEVALLSVPDIKVRTLLKRKKRGAKALARLKNNPDKMIITILIGNNIVNTTIASLATVVALQISGSSSIGIATAIITLIILVFGEITPKTLAATNAEKISLRAARPLELLSKLLHPVIYFLEALTNFMNKHFGNSSVSKISKLEMKEMINFSAEHRVIESREKEMMLNAIEIRNTEVEEIMTPISQLFSLDGSLSLKDCIHSIAKRGYARVPIYQGSKENLIGLLFVKEILTKLIDPEESEKAIINFAKKPLFLDQDIKVKDALNRFLNHHLHFAIIQDLDGNNTGVLTLEDLLEEIVGEIIDEHDITPFSIQIKDNNKFMAHAETKISTLNKTLKVQLPIAKASETIKEFFEENYKGKKKGLKASMQKFKLKLTVSKLKDGEPNIFTIKKLN